MNQLINDLRTLCPKSKQDVVYALGNAAPEILDEYEINSPLRVCHFWAQAAHESAGFKFMTEIWGPTDVQKRYEGRKDLGNAQAGDGYKYRGRGIFQLTGRANYKAMGDKLNLDLINNPELACEPATALRIACEYWKSRKLNVLADNDDLVGVTKKINGGTNGIASRKQLLGQAKKIWMHDDAQAPAPVELVKTMADSKQGNGAIAVTALGGVAAAKDVVAQAQDAADTMSAAMALLHNTNFLMMAAIVGLGIAIWIWRKKHLEEHGV